MRFPSTQRDIHVRFKQYVEYKLSSYIEELHKAIDKQADFIKYILRYKDFLIKEKFDISILYRGNIQVPININLEEAKRIDKMLYAKIRSLNYININRIPTLRYKIKIYSILREIDFSSYLGILRFYNSEIGNQVLKGARISLGKYLSTLEVVHRYIGLNDYNKKVNFWESLKLRKELQDKGIEVFSSENPDGVKYFIYYNTDEYYWFKWTKARVKHPNKAIYGFEPSYSINGPDIKVFKDRVPTDDEIFNSIWVGTANKLMLIQRYYPHYLADCKIEDIRNRKPLYGRIK